MLADPDFQTRIDSLRSWSPRHADEQSWAEIRRRSIRKRRRLLTLVGVGALVMVGTIGVAALSLFPSPRDGADLETRGTGSTTTGVDSVSSTTIPSAVGGAFDHLPPGWHEIDTGPVPARSAPTAWTGTELLVVAGRQLFGFEPVNGQWREFPSLPFDEDAVVAVVSMDGPLLAVADEVGGAVQSALLSPGATEWQTIGAVPTGYPAEIGIETGPRATNYGTSVVWTGERAIDSTHGSIFDPATLKWSPMPFPDDLVAFTHLLYSNPVWDGNALVMGYPYTLPGLAYASDGSEFEEFSGIDPTLVERSSVGPGLSVPLGDDVFFVRDRGMAATYSSRTDAWTVLPPVPGVGDLNSCPSHAASLGESVVVAPCYGEPPVYLSDGQWADVDEYLAGPCCNGQWLGIDGALVVWDSAEVAAEDPTAPRARVWVPPGELTSVPGLASAITVTPAPQPPPPEGASEDVGRCYDFVAPGEAHGSACLFAPGIHMWDLGDRTLLLARGGISLDDGTRIDLDESTGLAIVDYGERASELTRAGLGCLSQSLADVVLDQNGPDAPPFTVTACGRDFALVQVQYRSHETRQRAQLFGREDDDWELLTEVDFGLPTAEERCAVVPDDIESAPGRSLRDLCLLLG